MYLLVLVRAEAHKFVGVGTEIDILYRTSMLTSNLFGLRNAFLVLSNVLEELILRFILRLLTYRESEQETPFVDDS